MQRLHPEPHRFAHAPHLPVATLVNADVERRTLALRARQPHIGRTGAHAGLERHARAHATQLTRVGNVADQHLVALLHAVARVHELVRQLAVVGDEQEAAGVRVEPSHRKEPRPGRQEIAHRRPSLGVGECRDHADRLVHQEVAQRAPAGERASAHVHEVALGLDATPGLADHRTIDSHHAGFDQRVAEPARSDPARGEQLVEPNAVAQTFSCSAGSDSTSDESSSESSSESLTPND